MDLLQNTLFGYLVKKEKKNRIVKKNIEPWVLQAIGRLVVLLTVYSTTQFWNYRQICMQKGTKGIKTKWKQTRNSSLASQIQKSHFLSHKTL